MREIVALHPGAEVIFFNDAQCADALTAVEPSLVDAFWAERDGRFKSDMCRLAMLYTHGGNLSIT